MPEPDTNQSTYLESFALLVVDMQKPFLDAIEGRDRLLRRCRFAIQAASLLAVRTLFSEQVPEKLGDIDESLLMGTGRPPVFSKSSFSALGAPGLRDFLDEHDIRHLLLAGVETPICIYQSAIEATGANLSLTILSDCIGARRSQDAAATLAALRGIGCHVLPAEAVFYSILGDAHHPQFREFTNLVKSFNE